MFWWLGSSFHLLDYNIFGPFFNTLLHATPFEWTPKMPTNVQLLLCQRRYPGAPWPKSFRVPLWDHRFGSIFSASLEKQPCLSQWTFFWLLQRTFGHSKQNIINNDLVGKSPKWNLASHQLKAMTARSNGKQILVILKLCFHSSAGRQLLKKLESHEMKSLWPGDGLDIHWPLSFFT